MIILMITLIILTISLNDNIFNNVDNDRSNNINYNMAGRCQGSDEDHNDDDDDDEVDEEELERQAEALCRMKLNELKESCRVKGLKISGSKDALVGRLLGRGEGGRGGGSAGEALGLPDEGVYPAALAGQLGAGVMRELRDAVADDKFMAAGGLVGVPCMHLYEQVSFHSLPCISASGCGCAV